MFFGFLSGFSLICECLGTPFSLLTSVPLVLKPILTFSKGRNKLLYFVKDFFSQLLQSITLAPSRSPPKGRDRYHWLYCCWLVAAWLSVIYQQQEQPASTCLWQNQSNLHQPVFDRTRVTCISPSGENERGLKISCRVTCPFPWGRSGWVILRGRLGVGWCRYAE